MTDALVRKKAQLLVDLLADAEANHGGLIGTQHLRAANELRLELSRPVPAELTTEKEKRQ